MGSDESTALTLSLDEIVSPARKGSRYIYRPCVRQGPGSNDQNNSRATIPRGRDADVCWSQIQTASE